jgi:hypothetical protein
MKRKGSSTDKKPKEPRGEHTGVGLRKNEAADAVESSSDESDDSDGGGIPLTGTIEDDHSSSDDDDDGDDGPLNVT